MSARIQPLAGLVVGLALLRLAGAAVPAVPATAATAATAVTAVTAAAEIGYLLEYVGTSGCEFFRNGSWYDPKAAQAHLRYKYEALAASDQISTAEDFIDKVATKSSLSGRAYEVRCSGGEAMTTGPWLRAALARYRARGA